MSEAEAAPVDGWDFSWLDGRATEERPPWGYAGVLVSRVERADALLDVQTGGGELLAEVLDRARVRPATVAATEGWRPNSELARRNLARFGGVVAEIGNDDPFPFDENTFDLVASRHPVAIRWDEIARVLQRGGTYLGQHIGAGSNRELTEFMMGPQPVSDARSPSRAVADATAVGLEVVDVQESTLRVEFFDVGAVVYFLRKVVWTVPGFTSEQYRERLLALHERIAAEGSFVSHAQRFLIELRKP